MKCELVHVGTNVYVIGDRMRNMPPMRVLTEQKVIDLYKRDKRCCYRTANADSDRMLADGPFNNVDEAKKFIASAGYELKT